MSLMKVLGVAVVAVACGAVSASEATVPASPEAVVDAQLDAYNKRDLDAFLGFYADDAVLAKHPDVVTQTGKAEMRKRYERNFSNKNVRAEIIERVAFGRFVIDHDGSHFHAV